MRHRTIILVFGILWLSNINEAAVLGDAASTLRAGEFKSVVSLNTSNLYLGGRGTVFAFSNGGSWDPHTRQFLQIGAPHGSVMRFVRYQESDNTWYIDTSMPNSVSNDNWVGAHTYDQLTMDSSGVFYHIYWADGIAYRYDAPNHIWLTPLPATIPSYGCLDYFPDLNGLLRFSRGNISLYRIHESRWDTIHPGFAIESDYESLAEYCPAAHCVIFGGGSGDSRDLYRIDTNLVVTRLNPTPFNFRIGDFHIAHDPLTGIVVGCTADSLYAYNASTDNWYAVARIPVPTGEMGAIPVSTYGVIAFITNSSTPIVLYKFADHAWSANPSVSATVRSNVDTLRDGHWQARLRVYADIPPFGTDSGNTGVRFLGLDPALGKVSPDGNVFVNPMTLKADTALRIRVQRLGEWLPDTFRLPVKIRTINDSVRLSKMAPSFWANGCWAGWARLDSTEVVEGDTYPNSLLVTASSVSVYQTGRRYGRFISHIAGLSAAPTLFMVAVNNDTVFRSGPLTTQTAAEQVCLDISDADSLVLIARAVGSTEWCQNTTSALWGTPMLYNVGTASRVELNGSLPAASLKISPNPFNSRVAFSLMAPGGGSTEFRVYNASGRLVAELQADGINGHAVWDASGLASGVYLVKALNKNHRFVQRITLGH